MTTMVMNTTTMTTTATMTITTFMTIMNIVESRVVSGTRRVKRTEGTGVQTRAHCRAQPSASVGRALARNTPTHRTWCMGNGRCDQNLSLRRSIGSGCGYIPANLRLLRTACTAVYHRRKYSRPAQTPSTIETCPAHPPPNNPTSRTCRIAPILRLHPNFPSAPTMRSVNEFGGTSLLCLR